MMTNEFVLIFSIDFISTQQLDDISGLMAKRANIMEWNCDLEDIDHILRVVSHGNICEELISDLERCGVSAFVLAIFKKTKAGPELVQ